MNTALRYLLNAAHGGAENIKLIGDAFGSFNLFEKLREWLDANKLSRIGNSLACRLLDFMRLYPQEVNPKYLEEELQSVMERADARINTDANGYDILFAKLIETLGQSAAFSVTENETEFNQKYINVQNIINEQRAQRQKLKIELDIKYSKLAGTEDEQKQNNIFFEIQMLRRRLKKPLYTSLLNYNNIPTAFIIYCIAIDENPNFSPMARAAALYRVWRAENAPAFFKQKIEERYADFVTGFHYQVPCLKDASRGEFARELEKGLAFFGADTERKNIDSLVEKINRALPRWQEFFNEHPLSIADASQDGQCAIFPQRPYALNCRTKYKAPAGSGTVDSRHIEISDLTQANTAPLAFTLFNNHTIALAELLREYLRYQGIYNEAEVWINISYCLKAALTPEELAAVHAPLFRVIKPDALRSCASVGEKISKAKELIETWTMFIEIFVRPPPAAPPGENGAGEFTKDDAGLFAVGFKTPPLGAVNFCNAWNTW
jgi:hypothetical protein